MSTRLRTLAVGKLDGLPIGVSLGSRMAAWDLIREPDYRGPLDLCLIDLSHSDLDIEHEVRVIRECRPAVPILLLGPSNDVLGVAQAVRAGASEYLPDRTRETLEQAIRNLGSRHRHGVSVTEEPCPDHDPATRSAQAYRELFESANDIIFTQDLDGWFTSINRAGEKLVGYRRAEVLRMHARELVAPEFHALIDGMTRSKIEQGGATRYEVDLITKWGGRVSLEVSTRLLLQDGKPVGVQGIARDVSERKRAEAALRASEERLRGLLENIWLICVGLNLDGRIDYANPYFLRLTGYELDEIRGRDWFDVFVPDDCRQSVRDGFHEILLEDSHPHGEYEILTRSGERRLISWSNTVVKDGSGRLNGTLSIGEDITERREIEHALEHQALHDALTGLPNRALFRDRLQQALRQATRTNGCVGVLIMDLDRFKEVNDTYGHHIGDLLLQQVGRRLAHLVRESDTVARLGGDEFAVILRGSGLAGAERIARKAVSIMADTYHVGDYTLDVDASVGIALFPDHGADGVALLRQADVAMYVAKRRHLGWSVYAADRDEHSPARLALTADLRQAVLLKQVRLAFQPILAADQESKVRVEALLRWEHPDRGNVPPDIFIPLAEHTGLMHELTLWAIREALGQARRWHDQDSDVTVGVNISARVLHDPALAGTIAQIIRQTRCSPSWLDLEITESAVMADPERSMETLTRLREMGIRISIDDFGTGHSSLAYLQRLPVDTVKIDRRFIQHVVTNSEDQVIVHSVIDLAHNLGHAVVAEGVEDAETALLLLSMGCDLQQGYFYSRPVSADDVLDCMSRARGLTPRGTPPFALPEPVRVV